MIPRTLNFIVIGMLVVAAAWVYRIKFDSTVQAERLARLRGEVRHERDKLAVLRAEWGELDNPARIQALAQRFLKLKPIAATQYDSLDRLSPRPPAYLQPGASDPIGAIIEHLEQQKSLTETVPAAGTSPSLRERTAAQTPAARSAPRAGRPDQTGAANR